MEATCTGGRVVGVMGVYRMYYMKSCEYDDIEASRRFLILGLASQRWSFLAKQLTSLGAFRLVMGDFAAVSYWIQQQNSSPFVM